jgi:transposase
MAILREINKTDSTVKKTAFCNYCNKLKSEHSINNKVNAIGKELNLEAPKVRFIKRKDILSRLWSGEATVSDEDFAMIKEKHGIIQYLEDFTYDFKSIFKEKEKVMLTGFIEIYQDSPYSKIKSFVNGLTMDIDAVANAVELPYSNGFVEGNNNRLKMIKRMMYGRAKMPLLKTKILYGE